MGVASPPHRPTEGELEATRRMNLPQSDDYVEAMLSLVAKALADGKALPAIDILKGLVMIRPDEPRLYEAFGHSYRVLGEDAPAQLCFAEAQRISKER